VTCPTIRIHPAIVAHAAATCAELMPGRFFLGLGSGERLNEHVLGDPWPPADVRLEMLEEAVGVIRELWRGEVTDHRGHYFTVENARLYTLPAQPPPIYIAASGKAAARLAGRAADGMISTAPDREVSEAFEGEGNKGPRYAQFGACWASTDEEARQTALKYWPVSALKGTYDLDLAMPSDFEDAVSLVTEDRVAESLVCSSDARPHIARIQAFIDAGFDHVSVHQVGPEQEGAIRFYQEEVLPHFRANQKPKVATSNERKRR
jgi:G6PDH family F420-dependent oxidoreductase